MSHWESETHVTCQAAYPVVRVYTSGNKHLQMYPGTSNSLRQNDAIVKFVFSCLHAFLSSFPSVCSTALQGFWTLPRTILPTVSACFLTLPPLLFSFNKYILSLSPLVTLSRMISYYWTKLMLKESISRWQELMHVKMIRREVLPRGICTLAEGCALSKGWLQVCLPSLSRW